MACRAVVATREGGVDRNKLDASGNVEAKGSPPARVAWIETYCVVHRARQIAVATREGGVDRNINLLIRYGGMTSRHPRGWRG